MDLIRLCIIKIKNRVLRVEYKVRVLDNRVLRRIFGHKREEVAGGCRKFNNVEHYSN
jgi:hypothetical protein